MVSFTAPQRKTKGPEDPGPSGRIHMTSQGAVPA